MLKALSNWFRGLFGRKAEAPPVAFAWLLDEPRRLDVDTVRRLVGQALEIDIPAEPSEDSPRFVVGEAPSFMVKLDDHMLLLNTFPVPYMRNPEAAAKSIAESRIAQAVREHRAWVSADLLGEYEGEELTRGQQMIARIAAALADEHCLALYVTHTGQNFPYNPELVDALREEDPLGSLHVGFAPVTEIAPGDPDLRKAQAEARRRWPEFLEAYRNPRTGQSGFNVKLPISDGKTTEHIWVSVQAVEGDEILGDLANQPLNLKFMREGDRVRGRVEDVEDWGYLDGDELIGMFTVKVLQARSRR